MHILENQHLKITIHPKGAELQSIYHKVFNLEYMWDGNPAVWGKHSPILFPIVGTLKRDTYHYRGQAYSLGRHGFARDMEFTAEAQGTDYVTFLLHSNESTLQHYPFAFELRVSYRLQADGLTTTYSVQNPSDNEDLYFSVGGHPAFKVPLVEGTSYSDYYLEFAQKETTPRWPISPEGLIEKAPSPLLDNASRIPLTRELFAADALVLSSLDSSHISLRSDKTGRGLGFDFAGFPYLGIWAAKNADFVCIEPWCGIADGVDSSQELTDKTGINRLEPGGVFERAWAVTLF